MQHERDAVQVLIKTRGEGGYSITAPSNGSVHPSGRPYVMERGGFDTIAEVTDEEYEDIGSLARSFDRIEKPVSARENTVPTGARRSGDDFNERADWLDILVGWEVGSRGEETYLRRPGFVAALVLATAWERGATWSRGQFLPDASQDLGGDSLYGLALSAGAFGMIVALSMREALSITEVVEKWLRGEPLLH